MTSLFSRLQKLNKEATPAPWYEPGVYQGIRHLDRNCEWYFEQLEDAPEGANLPQRDDAALIVECRNSLPAVLNAIELLRRLGEWDALAPPVQAPFGDGPFWKREIDAALEPFNKEQT